MAKDSLLQFKGTTLKIIQTQLRSAALPELHQALADLTGNAPDFFDNDLAVLDFTGTLLPDTAVDWPGLRLLLRQSGLHAVATCGLPEALAAEAEAAGLPSVPETAFMRSARPTPRVAEPATPAVPDSPPPESADAAPPSAPPAAAATASVTQPAAPATDAVTAPLPKAIILDKPLRSGQRFYARGGDLIITAMVSAGAEVIADGNIHIYAPLRGRALAGASGDREARIFTTSFEAELVSVAGIYRTFEAGVPGDLARQPASVSLRSVEGESEPRLTVAAMALR